MQSRQRHQKYQVFTVETCPSCGFKVKRPFKAGDYIFRDSEECPHCKYKPTMIEMIYAEALKQ